MAFDGGWQTVVEGFFIIMEREKFTLETEEAQQVVWGDSEDYKVIEDIITGTSRWSIKKLVTIQRLSDGLFFQSRYSQGATESQDESPYEYGDAIFNQVFAVEKLITVYE